jgi:hypothetical protein
VPITDDYRTRIIRDPMTGKKSAQRFDNGYKMRWFTHEQQ